ncbi:uncharacterized protein [Rutidosis leptorrhynchoides]|uniref:uncharacterized protein n=1 Tax=Rutidosis leptorrhynchoides TaxID=125765 RepID=UPI003A998A2C
MKPLDFLVVDEAQQVKECELLIPLQLPVIRHVVLFGDECQLTVMLNSRVSANAGFGRSLFQRLTSIGHSRHLLNMQYRMHPSISYFPNSHIYGGKIFNAPIVRNQNRYNDNNYLSSPHFGPYSFINISCRIEEADALQSTNENMLEVAVIVKLLRKLYKVLKLLLFKRNFLRRSEQVLIFVVKVDSIDGFQGGEVDIAILSTVRYNNNVGSIGSLADRHRINVALTRARHSLWILGDGDTLFNTESIWKEIVSDAKDRYCFFNADDDGDLSKLLAEVKTELYQFSNLLNAQGTLYKDARWKVLFSNDFEKSFAKLSTLSRKKLVLYLLLRLSCGWRPKRRNYEEVCGKSSQIVKTFKVVKLYVICSVEIIKESGYTQVLKVWDILPLVDLQYLIERLDGTFRTYTENYINLCKAKYIEGDLEVPGTWSPTMEIKQFRTATQCLQEENMSVNNSLLLMKFYALSSGVVNQLLTKCDGTEIQLPFQLTDQEMEIAQFNKTSFILGRSGTGKSTVLIAKLFQREQLYRIASQGFQFQLISNTSVSQNEVCEISAPKNNVLRQMFVAVNPRLCSAVKKQISLLKGSTSNGDESSSGNDNDLDYESQFSDIPDSFAKLPPELYPIVISFNKFLMMLNGTVGNSFFETFPEVRQLQRRGQNSSSKKSVALSTFIRTKEVNYDRFRSSYWPHFNMNLTKTFEPSAVFREIMSHIKGQSSGCCLSREEYLLLSESRISTLSQEERQRIYAIFQQYEKKKGLSGEYDLADFVIDLHRRLRNEGYRGDKIDFVYIDETQDLNMVDLALFKYVCQNVEEGFCFAGDTAQTIGRGVNFRFEDIRSLFYKEFLLRARNNNNRTSIKGRVSDKFQLSRNFRSHSGVLNMAQSVVNLIYHFFPTSIDRLSPETSLIRGEVPVLLEANENHSFFELLKGVESFGGNLVGFGAEQAILVRDDQAKDEMIRNIGKQALVLTILDCKGLEFQDVLIYNFFSSSPFKRWGVICEYMKEQNLVDSSVRCSSFSNEKHASLCSELKLLYVAITRTRQRLWFYEDKFDVAAPFFDYWKKLSLIKFELLDDATFQKMQVPSSQAEWKSRGITLFHQRNYDSARMCFERAGDTYWGKLAEAAGLHFAADCARRSNPDMADRYLQKAAQIYESIDKPNFAAQCFFESRQYEKAGIIYLEKFKAPKWEKAVECFTLAGCYKYAADVCAKGRLYSKCLTICAEQRFFEVGFQYIKSWKLKIDSIKGRDDFDRISQKFLETAASHYHESKDFRLMMDFVKAFPSKKDVRSFLTRKACLNELLLLEEEWGNFLEAANIARQKQDIDKEISMLGKAVNSKMQHYFVTRRKIFN